MAEVKLILYALRMKNSQSVPLTAAQLDWLLRVPYILVWQPYEYGVYVESKELKIQLAQDIDTGKFRLTTWKDADE